MLNQKEGKVLITPKTGDFNSGWSSKAKRVDKCEWCTDTKQISIYLPPKLHHMIRALSEGMGSTEWVGYLKGKQVADGFEVEDIVIPEQTVSAALFKVDKPISENVIGTVHSHHSMGSFFSSDDSTYVGSNHPVTLVYSNREGYTAKVLRRLPCGSLILDPADLVFLVPDYRDTEKFVAEAKTHIKEKIYFEDTPYKGYVGYQGWQNQQSHWSNHESLKDGVCSGCGKKIETEQTYWVGQYPYCLSCWQDVNNTIGY